GTSRARIFLPVSSSARSDFDQPCAIGRKAARHAQKFRLASQILVPKERAKRKMQRLILNRQFVNVFIFGGVIVYGPTGRAQHQVSGLPLVALPLDSAVA